MAKLSVSYQLLFHSCIILKQILYIRLLIWISVCILDVQDLLLKKYNHNTIIIL